MTRKILNSTQKISITHKLEKVSIETIRLIPPQTRISKDHKGRNASLRISWLVSSINRYVLIAAYHTEQQVRDNIVKDVEFAKKMTKINALLAKTPLFLKYEKKAKFFTIESKFCETLNSNDFDTTEELSDKILEIIDRLKKAA